MFLEQASDELYIMFLEQASDELYIMFLEQVYVIVYKYLNDNELNTFYITWLFSMQLNPPLQATFTLGFLHVVSLVMLG